MGVAVTIAVGGCPPVRASSHMADSAVTDLVALELPLSLRVVHALITYAMMALNSLQLLRYYYSSCPGSPTNSHLSGMPWRAQSAPPLQVHALHS